MRRAAISSLNNLALDSLRGTVIRPTSLPTKIISEKSWEDSDANVRLHSKYVPSSYETQAATRCAFYALATLVCQRPFVTF